MQSKDIGSGVEDVFNGLASGERADLPSPPRGAKSEVPSKSDVDSDRPAARKGRPPGKSNQGVAKEKVTTQVSATLRDEYIEWAYEDRTSISELIERAMTEFVVRRARKDGAS